MKVHTITDNPLITVIYPVTVNIVSFLSSLILHIIKDGINKAIEIRKILSSNDIFSLHFVYSSPSIISFVSMDIFPLPSPTFFVDCFHAIIIINFPFYSVRDFDDFQFGKATIRFTPQSFDCLY